jgi:hypothetical protein
MNQDDLIKQFKKEHEDRQKRINTLSEKLQEIKFQEKHTQTKYSKDKQKEISEVFSFGKPVYVTSEDNKNFRTFTSKEQLKDFIDK